MRIYFKPFLLALSLIASNASWASFTGESIQGDYYFPDTSSLNSTGGTVVVGPGVEWPSFAGGSSIDISATNILIVHPAASSYSSATHNGPVFTDVGGTIPPITGVTINGATDMPAFDASRISFTDDTITINLESLTSPIGTVVSLDVQFASLASPQAAPALSEWMLILLALMLGGIGYTATIKTKES